MCERTCWCQPLEDGGAPPRFALTFAGASSSTRLNSKRRSQRQLVELSKFGSDESSAAPLYYPDKIALERSSSAYVRDSSGDLNKPCCKTLAAAKTQSSDARPLGAQFDSVRRPCLEVDRTGPERTKVVKFQTMRSKRPPRLHRPSDLFAVTSATARRGVQ